MNRQPIENDRIAAGQHPSSPTSAISNGNAPRAAKGRQKYRPFQVTGGHCRTLENVQFRFMLDTVAPVGGRQFRDATPVAGRQ